MGRLSRLPGWSRVDRHFCIGVRGMRGGYGERQERWTGNACWSGASIRSGDHNNDLCSGSHLWRSHESCCHHCLRNRQTLPVEAGNLIKNPPIPK